MTKIFRGRRTWISNSFVETFSKYLFSLGSAREALFWENNDFYKTWLQVIGVEESESVIGFSKFVSLIFSSRKGYFMKITIFYKTWLKVFGVEESESIIGFPKFSSLIFLEKNNNINTNSNTPIPYWSCYIPTAYSIALEDLRVPP